MPYNMSAMEHQDHMITPEQHLCLLTHAPSLIAGLRWWSSNSKRLPRRSCLQRRRRKGKEPPASNEIRELFQYGKWCHTV